MSWFDRRAAIAALAATAVSGCFRPMLAENTASAALRHRIALPAVTGRFAHYLVESLEERLGEPREPLFRLIVVPDLDERGLAVAPDDSVTRITVLAEATWSLIRIADGEVVLANEAFSQSGYNATTSLFATREARLDIEQRLARDIGARIARSILARADELAA